MSGNAAEAAAEFPVAPGLRTPGSGGASGVQQDADTVLGL